MGVETCGAAATMPCMPPPKKGQQKAGDKSPKQSGKHAKKRLAVNFTEDWHAVLRKLAARKKQPVLWYLLDLAREDAKSVGVETPPLPWEDESPET